MISKKLFTFMTAGLFLTLIIPSIALSNEVDDKKDKKEDKKVEQKQEVKDKVQEKVQEKKASKLLRFLKNGKVAIGSGEVTAISSSTLTVSHEGTTYTVQTNSDTKFRRKYWGKSELAEFSVGDRVNVIGKWQDADQTIVEAHMLRNLSIQKRHGVFFGKVTAVSATGFTIETASRGTQTVTVSITTKFVNRKEETIVLSSLKVGDQVRVRGLWHVDANKIDEVSQVKDFSQPVKTSPTPSATP